MATVINTAGLANVEPQEKEQKGMGPGIRVSKNGPRELEFVKIDVEEIMGETKNKGKHVLKTISKIVDDDIPAEQGGIIYKTFFVEGVATRKNEETKQDEEYDLVENLGFLLYSAGRTKEGVAAIAKKGEFDLDKIAASLLSSEVDQTTKQPKNRWFANLYLRAGKTGPYTDAGSPILKKTYTAMQQGGGQRWRKDPVLTPYAGPGTATVRGNASAGSPGGSANAPVDEPGIHVEV